MRSTDRTPANSVSLTSLCCRYSPGWVWKGGLCELPESMCVPLSMYLCISSLTDLLACVYSPSDVISPRVQDPPAEPPLQVFSAGEDRGVEGSV